MLELTGNGSYSGGNFFKCFLFVGRQFQLHNNAISSFTNADRQSCRAFMNTILTVASDIKRKYLFAAVKKCNNYFANDARSSKKAACLL